MVMAARWDYTKPVPSHLVIDMERTYLLLPNNIRQTSRVCASSVIRRRICITDKPTVNTDYRGIITSPAASMDQLGEKYERLEGETTALINGQHISSQPYGDRQGTLGNIYAESGTGLF